MATNSAEYMNSYMATYRKENPDNIKSAQKKWISKNKDYYKNYMKEYRAKKKAQVND